MRQHLLYNKGGTLEYLTRDWRNHVVYPATGTGNTASYAIYKVGAASTGDTATITGAATYGLNTTLSAAHIATSDCFLTLSSTAGIKPGDPILLTSSGNGYSELARVWRVIPGTSKVRLYNPTVYDYATGSKAQIPVLRVTISSAQAQSASLIGLNQNHRLEVTYTANGQGVKDSLYFDVVQRWPRPPLTEMDIYEARPELRDEMSDQGMVQSIIDQSWNEVLNGIRARGYEPQYLQNEEVLIDPFRSLVLHKLCHDVGQKTADDIWKRLGDDYKAEYVALMEQVMPLLRIDTGESQEAAAKSENVGVVRFVRGGRGSRN